MSMVAGLHEDGTCWCPCCGELIDVDLDDPETIEDGNKEYYMECPECHQSFYVSEAYN